MRDPFNAVYPFSIPFKCTLSTESKVGTRVNIWLERIKVWYCDLIYTYICICVFACKRGMFWDAEDSFVVSTNDRLSND